MRIFSTTVIFASVLVASGCRPPDAPEELDDLCAWLFTRFEDRRTDDLEVGLVNLDAWLDSNLEETLEGYAVSNLDLDAVGELPKREKNVVTDLAGAAVGSLSSYDPYALTWALVKEDQEEVFPGQHEIYEREFQTDPDCFMDRDCDALEVSNYMEDSYVGLVNVNIHNYGQYRWVDTDQGLVMIQRTWFTRPADVDVGWLTIDDQFYLNVLLPHGDGTLAVQAMWVAATLGSGSVPEGTALNMVIGQMQEVYPSVEEFIEKNGAADSPRGCAVGGGSAVAPAWLLMAAVGLAYRRRE